MSNNPKIKFNSVQDIKCPVCNETPYYLNNTGSYIYGEGYDFVCSKCSVYLTSCEKCCNIPDIESTEKILVTDIEIDKDINGKFYLQKFLGLDKNCFSEDGCVRYNTKDIRLIPNPLNDKFTKQVIYHSIPDDSLEDEDKAENCGKLIHFYCGDNNLYHIDIDNMQSVHTHIDWDYYPYEGLEIGINPNSHISRGHYWKCENCRKVKFYQTRYLPKPKPVKYKAPKKTLLSKLKNHKNQKKFYE